ncbi:MAG: hypothetical protein ACOX69_02925 [Coriobacteriales bacterium]|jgi:hypothetical protein
MVNFNNLEHGYTRFSNVETELLKDAVKACKAAHPEYPYSYESMREAYDYLRMKSRENRETGKFRARVADKEIYKHVPMLKRSGCYNSARGFRKGTLQLLMQYGLVRVVSKKGETRTYEFPILEKAIREDGNLGTEYSASSHVANIGTQSASSSQVRGNIGTQSGASSQVGREHTVNPQVPNHLGTIPGPSSQDLGTIPGPSSYINNKEVKEEEIGREEESNSQSVAESYQDSKAAAGSTSTNERSPSSVVGPVKWKRDTMGNFCPHCIEQTVLLTDEDHTLFRCPSCGRQYRPDPDGFPVAV